MIGKGEDWHFDIEKKEIGPPFGRPTKALTNMYIVNVTKELLISSVDEPLQASSTGSTLTL